MLDPYTASRQKCYMLIINRGTLCRWQTFVGAGSGRRVVHIANELFRRAVGSVRMLARLAC
jgi:hypothetical protein